MNDILFPLLYVDEFIDYLKRQVITITDAFANQEIEGYIQNDEEAWEVLYKYWMEDLFCWIELPKEYLEEDGSPISEADDEMETIMIHLLEDAIKKERGLKHKERRWLKQFQNKMIDWSFHNSEIEYPIWRRDFNRKCKIVKKMGLKLTNPPWDL